MFAIPGWSSVSTQSLVTQTADLPKTAGNGPESKPQHSEATTKQNKKRKRSNDKSKALEVNAENLGEMWETVIEEKPKSKGTNHTEKRQKIANVDDQMVQVTAEDTPALTAEDLEKIEKRKAKRWEKKDRVKAAKEAAKDTDEILKTATIVPVAPSKPASNLTPLQASMRQKLVSARFRHLNQTLYTTPSAHSLSLFQENPEMFQEYHEGFRRQVEVWPENPVDGYIAQIKARGQQVGPLKSKYKDPSKSKEESSILPLPRTIGTCYIADLGCGDAAISSNLEKEKKKLKLEIFSYDLQNPSPLVMRADIANLPLKDDSIDVAIFCLALMGTNWIDFIEEAYRILHWKGELWISEIKSRFGRVSKGRVLHSVGNHKKPDKKTLKKIEEQDNDAGLMVEVDGHADKSQETDVSAFVEVLRKRGFVLKEEDGKTAVDLSNRMFVRMVFLKAATPVKGKGVPLPKGMQETSWKPKLKKKFIEEKEDEDHDDEKEEGTSCGETRRPFTTFTDAGSARISDRWSGRCSESGERQQGCSTST